VQSLGSATSALLRAKVQKMAYKFEVYDGAAWQDLYALGGECYVKSITVTPSGAGPTPALVAGTWSAEIDNASGIFHPFNYSSSYHGLLRIGRKVRISIGGTYGGSAVYWQRLIGYMDAPVFDQGGASISLTGCDYSKRLADCVLRESTATSGAINGPLHWGHVNVLDSQDSFTVTGDEIYVEEDALDQGTEANSISGAWGADANVAFTSVSNPGGGSTYVAKMELTSGASGEVEATLHQSTAVGSRYVWSIKYRPSASSISSYLEVYQTKDSRDDPLALVYLNGTVAWHTATVDFITKHGVSYAPVDIKYRILSAMPVGSFFYFDEMSIKACAANWYQYALDATGNGPYYVTLNGEQVAQGTRDAQGHFDGWLWNPATNLFSFDPDKAVTGGTDNLLVYSYTDQTLSNVVADILKAAGLYASRALALAEMNYEATGITLERVWFEPGTTAQRAIEMVCERAGFRFWFDYNGVPQFRSVPDAGASYDFDFSSYGDLSGLADKQDIGQIRNSVSITGAEQKPFASTRDQRSTRYEGQASDATSIAEYLEHTESIENHLFQDAVSITSACAAILADRKDPKWYATLRTAFLPVPLEVGDTVGWREALGATTVTLMGVIRSITLTNGDAEYVCEVVEQQTSPGALPDIGAIEYQKGTTPPPATGLPDIGAVERQP
jgi:hypothetical protein